MKRYISILVNALLLLSACTQNNNEWINLFNGKNLNGFEQLNGKALFRVENKMLIGTTVCNQPNSFMATTKNYSDFILEYDVKSDPSLNSGVQFRSLSDPSYKNGRVHGYQCEIDPSDRAWSGGVYDEARRGWLAPVNDKTAKSAYKKHDWNHYRIEAIGNNIRVWLNGINTVNLYDNKTSSGFIAFQIHNIGNNKEKEGKEVRWKNIKIRTKNLEKYRIKEVTAPTINKIPNQLSPEEVSQGWKLLFDGTTTKGWRGAHKKEFPSKGWKIENGVLTVESSDGGESRNGGDIVTVNEYSAFHLSLEFKITEGANSGIKYFVTESEKVNPKAKRSAFGLEYQILDDEKHPDAKLYTTFKGSRTLASLYDMIKAENKHFNGVKKWNHAEIIVSPNNHVTYFLNGFKTLEFDRGSDDFRAIVKKSKYADKKYHQKEAFGEAPKGHILLQDHGDEVAFRSIKIKELK